MARAPVPPLPAHAPKAKHKVTDEILEVLRQEIVKGVLPIGSRMPTERQLAERFGVSQPTMREVMRGLDVIGLVEVVHGSGAYVRGNGGYLIASALQTLLQLEQVGVMEVLDVRQILGRESARLAATAATQAEVATIVDRFDALEQLEAAGRVEEVIEAILDFQRAVSHAAHNPLLSSIETFLATLLLEIQVRAFKGRSVRYWRTRSAGFSADRRKIMEAVRKRQPVAAMKAMDAYLDHQRRTFEGDPELKGLRLSDPAAVLAVASLVRELR